MLAWFLRVYHLGHSSLWTDELDTWVQSKSARDIWHYRGNGTLYFALAYQWKEWFGDSILALRILSAGLSLLACLLCGWIAWLYTCSRSSVLFSIFLSSTLGLLVWHGRDARMYPLWAVGFLLAWAATLELQDATKRIRSTVMYPLGNSIALLSHNFHVFFALALAITVGFSLDKRERFKTWLLFHLPLAAITFLLFLRLELLQSDTADYLLRWSWSASSWRPVESLSEIFFYQGPGREYFSPWWVGATYFLVLIFASLSLRAQGPVRRSFSEGGSNLLEKLPILFWLPFLLIHTLPIRNYARLFVPTALTACVLLACLPRKARALTLTLLTGFWIWPTVGLIQRDIEPWKTACTRLQSKDFSGAWIFTENRHPTDPLSQCSEIPYRRRHFSPASGIPANSFPADTKVVLLQSPPWVKTEESVESLLWKDFELRETQNLSPYLVMKVYEPK